MTLHERALPSCRETIARCTKQCMTGLLHMDHYQLFSFCVLQQQPTCMLLLLACSCFLNCRDVHPVAKKVAAVVACLVYMTISSALIVLNQQLMNEDGFRYPMALSGLGMGFSAVASYIACNVSALALHLSSILHLGSPV